jgi:starvation-inducible outer membrane lipoprotein
MIILQTLKSITVGKEKFFTGEYRFKLTTIVATQYKLHHHIRYVIVNKSGVGEYLINKD